MCAPSSISKNGSLRDLASFPILHNVVGLIVFALIYSSGSAADYELLNYVLYSGVFVTHWLVVFVVIRRFRRRGLSLKEAVASKKGLRWVPALLVFVSVNVLFSIYMGAALYLGRVSPPMSGLSLFSTVFYLVLQPVIAGFVEELVWRGYFIERLLARGFSEWKSIVLSSVSFAFIHGFTVVDKLAVTFTFGLIAGTYYVRERNLPVLMISHVVADMVGFGLWLAW